MKPGAFKSAKIERHGLQKCAQDEQKENKMEPKGAKREPTGNQHEPQKVSKLTKVLPKSSLVAFEIQCVCDELSLQKNLSRCTCTGRLTSNI